MQPSPQMTAHGATAPMLRSYGRWLPVEVIDTQGKSVPSVDARHGVITLVEDMYARIPALTSSPEHPVQSDASGRLSCAACNASQDNLLTSAEHQLGNVLCQMLQLGTDRRVCRSCPPPPQHWAWFAQQH